MSEFREAYYQNTKKLQPSPFLLEALSLLHTDAKTALDLGCGAGRDTKLLLRKGFKVTAVDSEPLTERFIDKLQQLGDLTYINSSFADLDYGRYDIVNARYSLPFNPPDSFSYVMSQVLKSINPGGVFVGQLFGVNDEWNLPNSNMTFLKKSEAQGLFSSFEMMKFDEQDAEGLLADGSSKHWHVFNIIARKK